MTPAPDHQDYPARALEGWRNAALTSLLTRVTEASSSSKISRAGRTSVGRWWGAGECRGWDGCYQGVSSEVEPSHEHLGAACYEAVAA